MFLALLVLLRGPPTWIFRVDGQRVMAAFLMLALAFEMLPLQTLLQGFDQARLRLLILRQESETGRQRFRHLLLYIRLGKEIPQWESGAAVERKNWIFALARDCGLLPEEPIFVVGVEGLQPRVQLIVPWPVQEEDSTAVRARGAVWQFPGKSSR